MFRLPAYFLPVKYNKRDCAPQERHLNFDARRGGISVKTEAPRRRSNVVSRLYISAAMPSDSGNYR